MSKCKVEKYLLHPMNNVWLSILPLK